MIKALQEQAYLVCSPTALTSMMMQINDLLHLTQVHSNGSNLIKSAYERKYIGCNFKATGGIGNQIWRFASLYGIGRYTGREPYFEAMNHKQMRNLMEISLVFPMISEILHVKSPPNITVKKLHFAHDCCKFDDPKKLVIEIIFH